jgi:hypothetical protein
VLDLIILGPEYLNEETSEVFYPDSVTLQMEHSLVSLSKWEQKFEKPFLNDEKKTPEEFMAYFEAMIVDRVYDRQFLYDHITQDNVNAVTAYMDRKSTATWFNEGGNSKKKSSQTITSELIYFWLSAYQIPFQPTETWHLNRILTLVRIHNEHQPGEKKKVNKADWLAQRRALMEQRRKKYNTNG